MGARSRRESTGPREDPAVQHLREENERLRKLVSMVGRLGRRITTSPDTPAVLQDVVDAACDLTGARYGALATFDASGRVDRFMTHGISPQERDRIGQLPQGLGLLAVLRESQTPMRLADRAKHPRSVGFPDNHPPMKSFLGAPIRHGDDLLGNLYLTEKVGAEEFTPDDEELLVLFSAQAAMAIRDSDVHQRVEAERARLRGLVDASPMGVVVAEAGTGKVLLTNREAERLLNRTSQPGDTLKTHEQAAVYRRPDGRVYQPDELPLQRCLARGERIQAEEVRFELPDGRTIPTLVNAAPVYSSDGTITSAIAVIQDITPLQEVERLRSEFLGMVSHELKTPLTAIKGSAATALGSQRALNDVETRELFEIIDEQSDRLRDLVDNLLDITRIEAGILSVTTERLDLRVVVDEAVAAFRRTGVGQQVRVEAPDELPMVRADRRRIEQVLSNLLNNAAKFSPPGHPITVRIESQADQAAVQVRDRGHGIPADKLPHLFKKFSRVHEDRGISGTGLGLAICKGIVEAHGGRIWVESPGIGQGTVITFTVPFEFDQAVAAGPEVTRRADHVGHVRKAGERARILAVDDEPQVLRLLNRTLEEAGYRPISTDDPGRVVPLVELEEPDLVLLDIMLPGTSGFELLERIREFSGVPVIFLTASDESDDAVRALKMGADDYIRKPFAPSELLARIEAVLRRRVLPDTLEVRPPFVLGDLEMNFAERRVTVGGRAVKLSATEYKLLYELATNAGRVLTHEQILQRVWGPEYSGETELVRSFIRNLRRKLGDDARNPKYIETEPQVGYRVPKR